MYRTAAFVCLGLLLGDPTAAGPVAGDEAEAPSGILQQTPGPLTDGATAAPMGEPGPSGAARATTAGGAEPTPSPSVQAAEIIREAQAGATAAEPARPAPHRSTRPPQAAAMARTPEGEDSLREAGKAAVQWLKDKVPWLRKDEQDEDADKRAATGATEWPESPLEGDKTYRGSGAAQVRLAERTGEPPMPADGSAGYGSGAHQPGFGPQANFVRETIELVRMVVEHPMTWLVMALFAVGGYAMSRFDRRPK